MKKIILSLLIILSSTLHAKCKLETFGKILKINRVQDNTIIKKTNCSTQVKKSFLRFISETSGVIKNTSLQHYFKLKLGKRVTIIPQEILIQDLNEFLEERLSVDEDIIISRASSLIGKSSLALESDQTVSVHCSSCSKLGEKNIKLIINGQSSWITAILQQRKSVFVAIKDINRSANQIDQKSFRKKLIIDNGRGQYFTDIKNLKYYKLNHYLRKGDQLKAHHLSAKKLIKYGDKVDVLFKSSRISLRSKAISRQNGTHGDFIQLYNPKSKKMITGRVIDYNKVVVEI